MTLHVYRFRREVATSLTRLESLAGSGLSFVDRAGGVIVDVQIDDTKFDDLSEALVADGLVYVSTDPTTDPKDDVEVNAAQLPTPTQVGQFLYSPDGVAFIQQIPVVTEDGFTVVTEDGFIVTTE